MLQMHRFYHNANNNPQHCPEHLAGISHADTVLYICCCCRCSEYASELVCPGLLQLAASLLTTPCSCPMHIVMAARQGKHGSLPPQASAGARAVRLGLLLLQEVFQVHAEARGEVLKACQVCAETWSKPSCSCTTTMSAETVNSCLCCECCVARNGPNV